MHSGWTTYYPIFISAAIGLIFPAGVWLISSLIKQRTRTNDEPTLSHEVINGKIDESNLEPFNTRVFTSIHVSWLLILGSLILVPCVQVWRGSTYGVWPILSVIGLSWLSWLYSTRKGDTAWLESGLIESDDG